MSLFSMFDFGWQVRIAGNNYFLKNHANDFFGFHGNTWTFNPFHVA
jgi:hypothetical protein